MSSTMKKAIGAGALTAFLLFVSGTVSYAQSGGQGGQQGGQQKQDPPPINVDKNAPPAVNPEEEAAFKAVEDVPQNNPNKKIELAEGFIQKYPQSRHRPGIYQLLVNEYFITQQPQKLVEAGEKEIEINANDAAVLAVMAQTLARTYKPGMPDGDAQLDKAELYAKRAIEVTPTLPKPAEMTDEAFDGAKRDALSMAHGGLGLVDVRRGKFGDAIPEFEESIKNDRHPDPDPVIYYLLGLSDDRTSHFDAAVAAYTKCAAVQSSLQANCKASADNSKKKAATELSAPK